MTIIIIGRVGDISGALRHGAKDKKDKNLNRDQWSFEYIIWFSMRGQLSHDRMFGREKSGGAMAIVNGGWWRPVLWS